MNGSASLSFKVVRQLAGDDWSDACLAEVPGFEAPLLVRFLKPETVGSDAHAAALIEGVRTLMPLRHPAVLSIHGSGRLPDGRVYVLTDYVDADLLAAHAELPVQRLVEVGVPLAEALATAHAQGLLHGAVNPERVWLTPSGPRLDFSLGPLLRPAPFTAAADVRALASMLHSLAARGEERAPFEATLRPALSGEPAATVLRDRLITLKHLWAEGGSSAAATIEQVVVEDPDLSGQKLGGYLLSHPIGEGAMGRVYLGTHDRLGRKAALKVLKTEHAGAPDLVQRFIQEATAVNAIKNEHIVEVFDFGQQRLADGTSRVFCVMELLEGRSLFDEMAAAPLSVRRVANIGEQLALAIHAAHAVGVVHRDLKPDNIFLQQKAGQPDYVKVLDFGMAKLLKPIGELPLAGTKAGVAIGTPEYMAPEQALGQPTDLRIDVYAIGLLLYEMLKGELPFYGETFGKLAVEITTRPVPPLRALSASHEPIPPGLVQVVMKCLSKQPGERYPSAQALAAALHPFTDAGAASQQLSDDEVRAAIKPARAGRVAMLGLLVLIALAVTWYAVRAPSATVVPPAPAAGDGLAPVAPEPAPAPEMVAFEVVSSPPGARVTRLDTAELLGVTPLTIHAPAQQGLVGLRLELEAHQAVERSVSLLNSGTLSVALDALAVPDKPRKRPKGPGQRNN